MTFTPALRIALLVFAFNVLSPAPTFGQEPFTQKVKRLSSQGLNVLRVALFASDEEAKAIRELIEEAEAALEPATLSEGVWKRGWELLRNPQLTFDLRRSAQNVVRLYRVSEDFESDFTREQLKNSAAMLALTHGTETVGALIGGTALLLQGEFAAALAVYGLILPFYDALCWVGQGALWLRPFRWGFQNFRKLAWAFGGEAVKAVGIKAAMEAVFEYPPVLQRLKEELAKVKENQNVVFDIVVPDDLLKKMVIRNEKGQPLLEMKFEENKKGELVLKEAEIHKNHLKNVDYRKDLKPLLKPFQWNVRGAIREIMKSMRRDGPALDLLREETTFVTKVEHTRRKGDRKAEWVKVTFRNNAVAIVPRLRRRPSQICENAMAERADYPPLFDELSLM